LWQAAAGLSNGSRSIPIGLGWLEEVIEVCNELLPTPTTSDTVVNEVDPATANRLLAEIDALEPTLTQRISTKYGQEIPTFSRSLRTCVTDISPDLAFRLLLCALSQYGVNYSLEQHARFVELGEHFSYGELLVLTTEYLAY
ncbi:hypothetical protein, partial [Actinokineospora pegani]|uniref:hypothetical protein n=1 Tax=Actinokineospora pegani TaxID=2654637 RepID=UPI0018D39889